MEQVTRLLQFIGIREEELPLPIQLKIKEFSPAILADPLGYEVEICQDIKQWFNSRPAPKVTTIPPAIGQQFYSLDVSEKVKTIDSNIDYVLKEVAKAHQRINDYLTRDLRTFREERLRLMGQGKLDLTEQLNAILEDPWWEYVSLPTPGGQVRFRTPPIVMRHVDKNNGIDMRVGLGRFEAVLTVADLRVEPVFDRTHRNMEINGYYHPHISNSFGVCWGTAHQVFTDGMKNFRYKEMFIALRAILENYNPASPYVELYRWALRQGKLDLSKYTIEYRVDDDAEVESIREEDLPEDFCHNSNEYSTDEDNADDDGESYTTIKLNDVYRRYAVELGCFCDPNDEGFYYKTRNGGYAVWPG